MKIGLFFGSFNPIHIGHLMIANTILSQQKLKKIWFVISPHNPLKKKRTLLNMHDRLDLVREAIDDNYNFDVCDIEFNMSIPSYTVNTLAFLREKHPKHEFSLLIGQDNLSNFHKWKNHLEITKHHHLYIYPRPFCTPSTWENNEAFIMTNAPVISLSSSYIRDLIKRNCSIQYLVPEKVISLIESRKYYLD